jgi:uncharacterized protein YndB with AHSA1/START domain
MPVFTNSVVINAVPEVVFDFAADPRNEREWNEDLESLELITEGEPGEGTSYYAKWKSAPERVRVDTVEFERPNRIVRHNGGSLEVTVSFAMEPADGGTRFTSVFDATPHGAFKVVFPLFAKKFQKDAAGRLLLVRDAIERRVAGDAADRSAA